MRRPFLVIFSCFLSLILIGKTYGQNPDNLMRLILLSGAISYSSDSPYAVPKKVAKLDDSLFTAIEGKHYESINIGSQEFAIYTNKRGNRKAFQILYSGDQFTLFCQHYVERDCDCFEGLAMAGNEDEKPIIIRELWPFSLKVNLVDRLNEYYTDKLDADDFNKVCDILTWLESKE